MRAERALRCIVPAAARARIERIMLAIVLVLLADDEEANLIACVVDEGVCDAGAGRKGDAVAGAQPMQMAVEPDIGMPLDDEDEFLLGAFRVRIGDASARRHAHVVSADALQAELSSERSAMCE